MSKPDDDTPPRKFLWADSDGNFHKVHEEPDLRGMTLGGVPAPKDPISFRFEVLHRDKPLESSVLVQHVELVDIDGPVELAGHGETDAQLKARLQKKLDEMTERLRASVHDALIAGAKKHVVTTAPVDRLALYGWSELARPPMQIIHHEMERIGEPPRSLQTTLKASGPIKAGDLVHDQNGIVGRVLPSGPDMLAELECGGCKRHVVIETAADGVDEAARSKLCGCGAVLWKTIAVVPANPHRHVSVGFDPIGREPRVTATITKDRMGRPLAHRPEDRLAYFGRGKSCTVSEGQRVYDELLLADGSRLRVWANAVGLQLCDVVTDAEIRNALFTRLFPPAVPESPMNQATPAAKSPVHTCMGLERCHKDCPAFGAWATEQLAIHERRISAHAPKIAVQCKGPRGCGRVNEQALGSRADHEGKCSHTWRWAPEIGMRGAVECTNVSCGLVIGWRAIEEVCEQAGLDPSRKYQRGGNDLADVAQRANDENRELLAENARLRRALEKAGRR